MANVYRITAPASTSNLGPGFDTLGLALDLPIRATIETDYPAGFHVNIVGEGQGILPEDSRNLILKTARQIAGDDVLKASWTIDSAIPLTRGLGSSAAAAAIGIAAGHLIRDGKLPPRHSIFEDIVKLENHPDNAGPTVFGGFRIGQRSPSGAWSTVPGLLGTEFRLLLVIPDRPVSTPHARSLLPGKYARAAVVRNTQNLATLLSGLNRADWDAVRRGCRDHLHEPYRLPLIPGLDEALTALRENPETGGAYLSGAGPTLAAFLPDERSDLSVADESLGLLAQQSTPATALIVQPEHGGLKVEQ